MPIDGLIPRDPQAEIRTRQTLDALANVLNGLIRSGDLVREADGWRIGRNIRNPASTAFLDDPTFEDVIPLPGATGPQGLQGVRGFPGLDGDPGEDALLIPGPKGPAGPQGPQGFPGLDGEDGQDAISIPGPRGPAGAQGQPIWLEDIYYDETIFQVVAAAAGSGTGTVTSVSVVTANGVSGTVATATTTPAITITLGAIKPSSIAATGSGSFTVSDASTNVVSYAIFLDHESSSAAAPGFGVGMQFLLKDSTTASIFAGVIFARWAVATHGSSQGIVCIQGAYNNAGGPAGVQVGVNSSGAATVGFFGTTPVAVQTGDVGTGLVTLGLFSGTPTYASANLTGTTTNQFIILEDQKSSGTNGGTSTLGSFQTRTLNTEVVDTGSNCSLASNQFTLTAGTYRIRAWAPGCQVGRHQIRLRNITDSTTTVTGKSSFTAATGNNDQSDAYLCGRFTISSSKTFEIQHQSELTAASVGFGVANSFTTEVYTHVEIEKEAT